MTLNIKLSRCLVRLEMDVGYNCLFAVTYIFGDCLLDSRFDNG